MRIPRLAALWAVVAIVLAACTGGGASPSASAGGSTGSVACKVGVSWNNFQQPRWAAADKPNLQETVEAGGGTYTDVDANLDSVQQLTDVENLINQGINVLVLLAQDTTVVGPALQAAADAGIPVIAYDRLIEDPSVLYITFDNVGVGAAEAQAMLEKVPTGTYVLIKGDPGDPNASTFLPQGWNEAGLQDAIDAGDITVFDEQFTDAWDTADRAEQHGGDHRRRQLAGRPDRCGAGRERQHGAGRGSGPPGQELRPDPGQRPGRRPRQPEQRRPGLAVHRRLEERQRARQGRRLRCAAAMRWDRDGRRSRCRTASSIRRWRRTA